MTVSCGQPAIVVTAGTELHCSGYGARWYKDQVLNFQRQDISLQNIASIS